MKVCFIHVLFVSTMQMTNRILLDTKSQNIESKNINATNAITKHHEKTKSPFTSNPSMMVKDMVANYVSIKQQRGNTWRITHNPNTTVGVIVVTFATIKEQPENAWETTNKASTMICDFVVNFATLKQQGRLCWSTIGNPSIYIWNSVLLLLPWNINQTKFQYKNSNINQNVKILKLIPTLLKSRILLNFEWKFIIHHQFGRSRNRSWALKQTIWAFYSN